MRTHNDDMLGGEPRIDGTRVGVRHVATRVIGSDQSPAHVSDQLDGSLASVSEALSSDDASIDELRELDRENEEAFERVRASSVNPNETVR
jgi:uncharacterized protein (DUF433 family)